MGRRGGTFTLPEREAYCAAATHHAGFSAPPGAL